MSVSMKQIQTDMDPCFKGSISLDAFGKLHRWGYDLIPILEG